MKFLGIDYGERRTGLAIGDTEQKIAIPLRTLAEKNVAATHAAIERVVADEQIDGLVIGEPLTLMGERGPAAERVRTFAQALQSRLRSLPIFFVDERMTSQLADRVRAYSGQERDALAAAAILQTYLDGQEQRKR